MKRLLFTSILCLFCAGTAAMGTLWWATKHEDPPTPVQWFSGWNAKSGTRSLEKPSVIARSGGPGFRRREQSRTKYGRQYALIIGVNAYDHKKAGDLSFAYNDARAVRDVLYEFGYEDANIRFYSAVRGKAGTENKGKAIPEDGSTLLADSATLHEALFDDEKGWLGQLMDGDKKNGEIHKEDAFFFFYAGHGDEHSDEGFLLPCDAEPYNRKQCIYLEKLKDRLAWLRCKHKAVILDACYSGSLFVEPTAGGGLGATEASKSVKKEGRALASDVAYTSLRGKSSSKHGFSSTSDEEMAYYFNQGAFVGLTAGREKPVADGGGADSHSIFTANLLDVLNKRADSARDDHAFTFRELAMMVERGVRQDLLERREEFGVSGISQIPRFGYLGRKGDGDFIFRETIRKPTPREQALAEEGRKWLKIAESYVDEKGVNTYPHVQLFATKALGFDGYGREDGDYAFKKANPICFHKEFHREDRARASGLIQGSQVGYRPSLLWSSPISRHHGSEVNIIAWSPNGSRLASASGDKTIKIWDVSNGALLEILEGHVGPVNCVAWNPGGTHLASGSDDSKVLIWSSKTGKQLAILKGHAGSIDSVAWNPEGTRIASASDDQSIKVWDPTTNSNVLSIEEHFGGIRSIGWSPDGKLIVGATSDDRVMTAWDAQSGAAVHDYEGPGDLVLSVDWHPDGDSLVTASLDRSIRIWNVSGEEMNSFHGHWDLITSVAWSPNGERLVCASVDGKVRFLNPKTGKETASFEGFGGPVNCVAWNPEGTRLASGLQDGTVHIHDLNSERQSSDQGGRITCVKWNPDGSCFASGSDDGKVRIWSFASLSAPTTFEHNGVVNCVAWKRDGSRLASGGNDGLVRIWDPEKGTQPVILDCQGSSVFSVAWNPDGSCLASASDDGKIRIWDLQQSMPQAVIESHGRLVLSVDWSPDGESLASASDEGTVRIWTWDSMTLTPETTIKNSKVVSVVWSMDGARLACASRDGSVRIWNQEGNQLANLVDSGDPFVCVDWSPDGRLASSSRDGKVWIWRTGTNTLETKLWGHGRTVNCVDWSPDGSRLVSASNDETIRIWDSGGSAQLERLSGHDKSVASVAWNSEGLRIASASSDGTVRLWDPDSGMQLAKLDVSRDRVQSVAWNPDHNSLAIAADSKVQIWNPLQCSQTDFHESWRVVLNVAWDIDGTSLAWGGWDRWTHVWNPMDLAKSIRFENSSDVNHVDWKPDGTGFACALSDGKLLLWNLNRTDPVASLGHGGIVWTVAWDPNGDRLASASLDGVVRLWDVASETELASFWRPYGSVLSLSWNPDLVRLGIGADDGLVRVWDTVKRIELISPGGHNGRVNGVVWSPDGSRLASASEDKTVRIWNSAAVRRFNLDGRVYFEDDWVRLDETAEGLSWISVVSDNLYSPREFEYLGENGGNIGFEDVYSKENGAVNQDPTLVEYYLCRGQWHPAWIWWRRLSDKAQRPLIRRLATSLCVLAKDFPTDAPSGWYSRWLGQLREDHPDAFWEWLGTMPNQALDSFSQAAIEGPPGRQSNDFSNSVKPLNGLETIALDTLDELVRRHEQTDEEPDPRWEAWEKVLRQRLKDHASPQPDGE